MTPREIMLAHQYLYYEMSETIWSDYAYDKFCERNGLDGNGGPEQECFTEKIMSLAKDMLANPGHYPNGL